MVIGNVAYPNKPQAFATQIVSHTLTDALQRRVVTLLVFGLLLLLSDMSPSIQILQQVRRINICSLRDADTITLQEQQLAMHCAGPEWRAVHTGCSAVCRRAAAHYADDLLAGPTSCRPALRRIEETAAMDHRTQHAQGHQHGCTVYAVHQ